MSEPLRLGIFTTDHQLVVRTWDAWMAAATGIPAEDALNRALGDVLPSAVERDFGRVLEHVLSCGRVEVLGPGIHGCLFPCAPTTASARFERMQQQVTVGPLREEGAVVGLVVTVEDVTSRVDEEQAAVERLADRAALPEAAEGATGQHIRALTTLLGDEEWHVRRRAVTALAEQGHAIVEELVRTLQQQHADLNVLSSALDLLALSDIDIVEPLVQCLQAEDANLRVQAALILGERRDRRAVPSLIARLADPDTNVRFHVIEALGRLHATEACEELAAVALDGDFFLAFPAIQALTRIGTPALAARLVPLLADPMLRTPAIEALGELGDEDVATPLVDLLNLALAPVDVIAAALAGLSERYEGRYGAGEHIAALVRRRITAMGTQQILDAVHRVDADRLPGLAKVLGWLEGEGVQRALTRLLGQRTVRAQVVEALVRNGSGVVALLIEQLRAEDLETRQAAAVALGRIGDCRATPALVDALDEQDLAVPAAGALARLGDGRAFEPLIRRLGDPDPAIRQAIIAALNSIGHPEMPVRIGGLLDDPDPSVREAALRVAGYFGYPECLEQVLARCADEAEAVRRAAVEQLAFFEQADAGHHLLEALDDPVPGVRSAAAAALGRVEHPRRLDALIRALEDADAWVRYVALKSLGTIGPVSALPAVVTRLRHDPAPHVRLAAIDVVARLRPPDAMDILEPLTRSASEDVARAAFAALGHIDQPGALALLEHGVRAPASWQRLAAIHGLTLRTEALVPGMLQRLAAADADEDVAAAAVDALARMATREDCRATEAAQALVALAAEPGRRPLAVAALSRLPARRTAEIAGGLRHPCADVRCAIVEALGRMKRPDSSRVLDSALDDPAPMVRLAAVSELRHLGVRTSVRKLMALARTDPVPEVRQAAVRAIARTESVPHAGWAR